MQDLARDLGAIAGAPSTVSDEQHSMLERKGRCGRFFDLFAAKASLALAGDPDERARLLSLLPRAEERRTSAPRTHPRLRLKAESGIARRPFYRVQSRDLGGKRPCRPLLMEWFGSPVDSRGGARR